MLLQYEASRVNRVTNLMPSSEFDMSSSTYNISFRSLNARQRIPILNVRSSKEWFPVSTIRTYQTYSCSRFFYIPQTPDTLECVQMLYLDGFDNGTIRNTVKLYGNRLEIILHASR